MGRRCLAVSRPHVRVFSDNLLLVKRLVSFHLPLSTVYLLYLRELLLLHGL